MDRYIFQPYHRRRLNARLHHSSRLPSALAQQAAAEEEPRSRAQLTRTPADDNQRGHDGEVISFHRRTPQQL
jgi:hypothetical protein